MIGADDVGLHQIAKVDQLLYPPAPDKGCKLMVDPRFFYGAREMHLLVVYVLEFWTQEECSGG